MNINWVFVWTYNRNFQWWVCLTRTCLQALRGRTATRMSYPVSKIAFSTCRHACHPFPLLTAPRTRVQLPQIFGHSNSDYINGNYTRVGSAEFVKLICIVLCLSGLSGQSWSIHCNSGSSGEYSWGFLAHGPGQQYFSCHYGHQLSGTRNCTLHHLLAGPAWI